MKNVSFVKLTADAISQIGGMFGANCRRIIAVFLLEYNAASIEEPNRFRTERDWGNIDVIAVYPFHMTATECW